MNSLPSALRLAVADEGATIPLPFVVVLLELVATCTY
jgi:hypothetical protein